MANFSRNKTLSLGETLKVCSGTWGLNVAVTFRVSGGDVHIDTNDPIDAVNCAIIPDGDRISLTESGNTEKWFVSPVSSSVTLHILGKGTRIDDFEQLQEL